MDLQKYSLNMKIHILKQHKSTNIAAHLFLFKIYRPKLNWEQTKVFGRPCATFFCRKIDFFQKKLIFGAYIMKFDQISKLAKN